MFREGYVIAYFTKLLAENDCVCGSQERFLVEEIAVVVCFMPHLGIKLEELRNTKINASQYSHSPEWNSKRIPVEYRSDELTPQ
jgi:hypothetical protein